MNQKWANSSLCSSPRSSPATVLPGWPSTPVFGHIDVKPHQKAWRYVTLWHLAENVARTTVPDTSNYQFDASRSVQVFV
jgi:hypothetical protein